MAIELNQARPHECWGAEQKLFAADASSKDRGHEFVAKQVFCWTRMTPGDIPSAGFASKAVKFEHRIV